MHKIKREDGWEIHEILEKLKAKRITKYFYKRNQAPRIILKDGISKQLAGYTLIEKDLRNVIFWLTEIEKLHPSENRDGVGTSKDRDTYNLVKGLYVSSLTFYGKCFTTSKGRKIKLEKQLLDEKYHETHDTLMHMRNNFAAHSGVDTFEKVEIALVLHPNKKSDMKPKIFRELMQPDIMDDPDSPFIDLVKHTQEKVTLKISELEEKILEKIVAPKGKSYWYSKYKKLS